MKTTCVLLSVAVFLGACSIASGQGFDACGKTSIHALSSCRNSAHADYWLDIGKCDNLSTPAERHACRALALEERGLRLDDCQEQFDARQDVCSDLGSGPYNPVIDPKDFVTGVDHEYFPLTPGRTLVYEGVVAEGLEHVEVCVTDAAPEILGVACVEVHDVVYLNSEIIEDTLDWYAQDKDGYAWYMGENVRDLEDGLVVSLAGSWTAGVDGARPGIIMKAKPEKDDLYRQEFLLGEAEDLAEVLSVSETVTVDYGTFKDCLLTEEFTPLDPGVAELKYYAPGIGLILIVNTQTNDRVELIDILVE